MGFEEEENSLLEVLTKGFECLINRKGSRIHCGQVSTQSIRPAGSRGDGASESAEDSPRVQNIHSV